MLTKIAGFFGYPWLCRHQFELIAKVNIYAPGKRMPVAKEYHLACTKCAEIRKRKVTA